MLLDEALAVAEERQARIATRWALADPELAHAAVVLRAEIERLRGAAALPSDGPPKTQQEIIDRFAWAAERMSREQIAAALAGVSNLKGAAPPVAYAPVEHRTAWR